MNFSQRYFPGLDGLRAVSVFLVLLHHIGMIFYWWPFQGSTLFLSNISFFLMQIGFVGVDVFFVISGFLIAGLLLEDLQGPLRLERFYVRRAFKILPQYLIVVMVGILMSIAVYHQKYPALIYLKYFFCLQNYSSQIEILRHLWTIAVEEHFYIFLPVIFWAVWSLFKKAETRIMALVVIFLLLIASANIIRWFDSVTVGLDSINQPPIWQFTHRRFDALVFGCLVRIAFPVLTAMKESFKIIPLLSFAFGCALATFVFSGQFTGWMDYSILYVSCGLFLLAVVLDFGLLTMALELKWIKFVGRNSYGIYIWHMTSIFFFRDLFKETRSIWFVVLYVCVTLLLGMLSTQAIEKRFLDIRKQMMP